VPKGIGIRPTAARARKALFDSLVPWTGKTVVDLFAGAGSLGLEAASRGAANVVLVEKSRSHCQIIEENIARICQAGVRSEIKVICGDAVAIQQRLPALKSDINFIFADPPYAKFTSFSGQLLTNPEFADWAGKALFIWELPDNFKSADLPPASLWNLQKRRKFARTEFLFGQAVG